MGNCQHLSHFSAPSCYSSCTASPIRSNLWALFTHGHCKWISWSNNPKPKSQNADWDLVTRTTWGQLAIVSTLRFEFLTACKPNVVFVQINDCLLFSSHWGIVYLQSAWPDALFSLWIQYQYSSLEYRQQSDIGTLWMINTFTIEFFSVVS